MKATKFVLALAFIAFATLSYAQADRAAPEQPDPGPVPCVKIKLEEAILDRGLVKSMYQQLTPRILLEDKPFYIATVAHKRAVYFIAGTYDQWKKFFIMDLNDDPKETRTKTVFVKPLLYTK